MVDLLDSVPNLRWRNFSLPWYDPAFPPHTMLGDRIVRERLEGQVRPAAAVILLCGVYERPSCREWLDLELAIARHHGKPVIALPPRGKDPDLHPGMADMADAVCAWDAVDILVAVDRLSAPSGGNQQSD